MEILFEMLSTILIFLFTIFTLFVFRKDTRNNNLPPGPRRLPLIGNLHQLASSKTLPHLRLAELAQVHGPIMYLRLGEVPTVVISSADMAKEVLKTHDSVFINRPRLMVGVVLFNNCTDIGFAPYGKYWREIRKICMLELFVMKRVQLFRPIREEEVTGLVKDIASKSGSIVNLSKHLFDVSFDITSRITINTTRKNQEEFRSLAKDISKISSGFAIADLYPSFKVLYLLSGMRKKLEQMAKESNRLLDNIINAHISKNRHHDNVEDDLVDVLLKFYDNPNGAKYSLTKDNIKSIVLDIFTGGSETTSTTIEWAMSELLKNPKVMEKAQAEVRQVYAKMGVVDETRLDELKYLKMVIKETLRLHPPGALLVPRESVKGCSIDGYDILPKTRLIINAWAIGRDPKYWTNRFDFHPERFENTSTDFKGNNFELIPFGAGKRKCPGMLLSVANIEIQLATLLYHFDWKLPYGSKYEDLNMDESFGLSVRRKQDLIVMPRIYAHSSFI